ncbi:MAG: hypothetical protein WC895_03515 [Candidatus Shapirobacteria bacterium]|jgi:hypothetical protein
MCDNSKVIKFSSNDSTVVHQGQPSEKATMALSTFIKWWEDPTNQTEEMNNILQLSIPIHIAFNEAYYGFGVDKLDEKKHCYCPDCRFLMKVRKQLKK